MNKRSENSGEELAAQRLAAIVESSDDAIVSKDLNGVVTSWNGAAERIFGYTADEMIGRPIHVIIPPERRSEEAVVLDRIRRGDSVDHFETVRRRKDGRDVTISLTVSPIRDASGAIVGASKIARDVTDRKLYEAERDRLLLKAERAREEAERANRAKDEFLATLSHELRSPLNAISGWSQLARTQIDEVQSPTVRSAFEVIERNVQLQARLINDLLDVSSIVNGKLPLRSEIVDMAAVVTGVVNNMRPEASAKAIPMDLEIAGAEALVQGDSARLEQVVWNLLSNALKFTPRGGDVRVALQRDGDEIRVVVADSGEGIPEQFLPHVFDRFRQADPTTTRRHGGLGLGLAVVQHLVHAHGGRISVASAGPGLGATFTAVFPAAAASTARAAQAADESASPLEGVRVLIVDDDQDARDLLEAMLLQHRATPTTAASVRDALERLRGPGEFAVLISDLAMPGQDGFELIQTVRADARPEIREIPAVAVTAHANAAFRARALKCGFDDYLAKPVDATRLVKVIEELLRARRQLRMRIS